MSFKTKTIFILVLALIPLLMGYAADDKKKKKDEPMVLTGEHPEGGGYKVFFSKDKEKFFHLRGFTRLYFYPNSTSNKLNLRYFRFYMDGQSSKKWAFHTRFDYNTSFFMSKGTTLDDLDKTLPAADPDKKSYGASAIYFARAYVTYTMNDNVSFDFGRMINFFHKYDVISNYSYEVSEGVAAKYKKDDLNVKFAFNYSDSSQRMAKSTKSETMTVSTRADYAVKLGKDKEIKFGTAVAFDFHHNQERFQQFMPDFGYFGAGGFYLIDQMLYKELSGTDNYIFENYIEVGIEWTKEIAPDLYFTQKRIQDAKTEHAVGVDVVYTFSPSFTTVVNLEYEDFLDANDQDLDFAKKFSYMGYIQYSF